MCLIWQNFYWIFVKKNSNLFYYRTEHLQKMKRRPARRLIVNVNVKRLEMQQKKRNVSV